MALLTLSLLLAKEEGAGSSPQMCEAPFYQRDAAYIIIQWPPSQPLEIMGWVLFQVLVHTSGSAWASYAVCLFYQAEIQKHSTPGTAVRNQMQRQQAWSPCFEYVPELLLSCGPQKVG